jgi:hypothetical protein
MLHIYRQITALERFRPIVIAQKREEAERFPFEPVFLVRAASISQRFGFAPWYAPGRSLPGRLCGVLDGNEVQLLHIYFDTSGPSPASCGIGRNRALFHFRRGRLVDLDPRYRSATREVLTFARLVLVRCNRSHKRSRSKVSGGEIRVHRWYSAQGDRNQAGLVVLATGLGNFCRRAG